MSAISLQPSQAIQNVRSAAIDAVRVGGAGGANVTPAERQAVVSKFREAIRNDPGAVASAMSDINTWFGSYSQNGVNLSDAARTLMQDAYKEITGGAQGAPRAPDRP